MQEACKYIAVANLLYKVLRQGWKASQELDPRINHILNIDIPMIVAWCDDGSPLETSFSIF